MIPFLVRGALAAVTEGAEASAARKAASAANTAKKVARPKTLKKPNKMLGKGRVPAQRPATPTKPSPRPGTRPGSVTPQPRVKVPTGTRPRADAEGNRAAPDPASTGTYGKGRVGNQSIPNPTPNNAPTPNKKGEDHVAITDRLLAGAVLAQNALSSYIPSQSWTGTVSARGFKTTPLRTVLHYCLAVVFGTIQQTRVGAVNLTVNTFPMENRVEVVCVSASVLLLEPVNIAIGQLLGARELADEIAGRREVGSSEDVAAGIKKFNTGNEPLKGVRGWLEAAGNAARRVGPLGMWDMGQSSIYAGSPPGSLSLGGLPEPFTSMETASTVDKMPMLTRTFSTNPQAPVINDVNGNKVKHYPTHFDLRSLVAQALYDPGVLPPPPDTFVGFKDATL